MGKKNIQPNSSQPVFRSLVARPALEELREENLTEGQGQAGQWGMAQQQRANGQAIIENRRRGGGEDVSSLLTVLTTEKTSKNFSVSHNSRKCQKSFPSCFGGLFASTN